MIIELKRYQYRRFLELMAMPIELMSEQEVDLYIDLMGVFLEQHCRA